MFKRRSFLHKKSGDSGSRVFSGLLADLLMPGRDFASPADFDAQFTDWLSMANSRIVRTTKARPVERLDADRAVITLTELPR